MNEDLCSSLFFFFSFGKPRAGRWIGCYFFSAIRTAQTPGPGLVEQSRRNDAPVGRNGREGERVKGCGRGVVEKTERRQQQKKEEEAEQAEGGQETRVKEQGSNGREQVSPPPNKFGASL